MAKTLSELKPLPPEVRAMHWQRFCLRTVQRAAKKLAEQQQQAKEPA